MSIEELKREPVAWVWNPAKEAWEQVRAFGHWQQGATYAFGPTPPAAPVLEGRDWSLLEATQESLREHMAEIKRLKAAQRQWVGLTDADKDTTSLAYSGRSSDYISGYEAGMEAAEDKLRQKNGGV